MNKNYFMHVQNCTSTQKQMNCCLNFVEYLLAAGTKSHAWRENNIFHHNYPFHRKIGLTTTIHCIENEFSEIKNQVNIDIQYDSIEINEIVQVLLHFLTIILIFLQYNSVNWIYYCSAPLKSSLFKTFSQRLEFWTSCKM